MKSIFCSYNSISYIEEINFPKNFDCPLYSISKLQARPWYRLGVISAHYKNTCTLQKTTKVHWKFKIYDSFNKLTFVQIIVEQLWVNIQFFDKNYCQKFFTKNSKFCIVKNEWLHRYRWVRNYESPENQETGRVKGTWDAKESFFLRNIFML